VYKMKLANFCQNLQQGKFIYFFILYFIFCCCQVQKHGNSKQHQQNQAKVTTSSALHPPFSHQCCQILLKSSNTINKIKDKVKTSFHTIPSNPSSVARACLKQQQQQQTRPKLKLICPPSSSTLRQCCQIRL
jgi:hypothetical protein